MLRSAPRIVVAVLVPFAIFLLVVGGYFLTAALWERTAGSPDEKEVALFWTVMRMSVFAIATSAIWLVGAYRVLKSWKEDVRPGPLMLIASGLIAFLVLIKLG